MRIPSGLKLKVRIFSAFQTYYEGNAVSVSAVNPVGPFDILPGHINFLSILLPGPVVINDGQKIRRFELASGIIKVEKDAVTLFANV